MSRPFAFWHFKQPFSRHSGARLLARAPEGRRSFDETHEHVLATRFASEFCKIVAPLDPRGHRECRMLAAPASLACKRNALLRTQAITGQPDNRHSLRNGVTAYTWSPRCAGLSGHRRRVLVTRGLISASGDRDRTISPSASHHSSVDARRPSHPAPTPRDDREAPLFVGRGTGE